MPSALRDGCLNARMVAKGSSRGERNSDLIRFLVAYTAGVMSERTLLLSTVVYAYERGGSATAGFAALGLLSPRVVAAPFAAKAADGARPNRTFLGLFLVKTIVLIGAATGAWTGAPLAVVVCCAGIVVGSISFLRPTAAVVVPGLVRSARQLTTTNLRMGLAGNASALIGPLTAAILIRWGGPALALTACAALNALAVLATLPLRRLDDPRERTAEKGGAIRLLVGQIEAMRQRPSVPSILAVAGAQYVLLGSLDLIYVVLTATVFDLGRSGSALLGMLFGVGALANGLTSRLLVARGRLAPLVVGALILMAICLSALGAKPALWVAFVALPIIGFSRSLLDLSARMLLQRSAPPGGVASAFAVVELLSGVGAASGAIITQILIAWLNVRAAIFGIVVVFFLVFVGTIRRLWKADDGANVPVVAIRLLRTLPVFSPMSPTQLESVAGSAREISLKAGTKVICEGEEGDCFYAVSSGKFDVVMQGEHVRFAERGGSFGEVALLTNVPRTATITAVVDGELLAIDRGPFLAAVTGHDSSRQAAWGVMRGMRLGFELSDDGPIPD
jgi:Cyclic nucleotide-binding domain/Major Facilitator Superfamily